LVLQGILIGDERTHSVRIRYHNFKLKLLHNKRTFRPSLAGGNFSILTTLFRPDP
jgi:hypothetical protein